MKKSDKILHYRKYLFMYGIITLILVRDYFEGLQDYEECAVINEAISEQELMLGTTFPKVIDDNCILEVVNTYKKFNLTGKNALENSGYYSLIVIDEILKMKQK